MGYKKYTFLVIGMVLVALLCTITAGYIVDPIGIWGGRDIQGVNQSKIKQAVYLDVYKPYEFNRVQPDVIWIGTSRVYVGFAPDISKNEYNMGMSSLSLADARKYLQFAYNNKCPKKVYLGLDLFQFGPEYRKMASTDLLDWRLKAVSTGGLFKLAMGIKDSFGVKKTIWPTVKDSWATNTAYFQRGWDVKRGSADRPNADEYYGILNSFRKTYDDFRYDEAAMDCLRDIVQDASEHNVVLVIFFNPISVDLQALQDICGLSEEYYKIKKMVAAIHPVYDFCFVNEYTVNRNEWFYDASHFRAKYGNMCRERMDGRENGTAYLMDSNNADEIIAAERKSFTDWQWSNTVFYQDLAERSNTRNIKTGSLKNYIGI